MPVVYLVGARGSGKTSAGQALAERLGFDFADLDAHLIQSSGLSIAEIVAKEGWPGFRKRESECLKEVTSLFENKKGIIIATGGGIILDCENRLYLKKHGLVLWLKASPKILHMRLSASLEPDLRPSLTGKNQLIEIEEIVQQREKFYRECAHHTLDGEKPIPEICNLAMRPIKQFFNITIDNINDIDL